MSQNSNVTSGFIDLATFDELEKYMYGGDTATAYFVRQTVKVGRKGMKVVILCGGLGTSVVIHK